jgi:hypothetical protein
VLQALVVLVLVVGSAAYAAWTLLPAAGRRRIARMLLKGPLPGALARFFTRHATEAPSPGCGSCERNADATRAGRPPAEGAPLVFHRRSR